MRAARLSLADMHALPARVFFSPHKLRKGVWGFSVMVGEEGLALMMLQGPQLFLFASSFHIHTRDADVSLSLSLVSSASSS